MTAPNLRMVALLLVAVAPWVWFAASAFAGNAGP